MLKNILLSLFVLFSFVSLSADYAIPPVREINGVKIVLRPEKVGSKVRFSFDKQDINGYIGTDAVVFTILAPGGATACETLIPDDGNASTNWQTGPRMRVEMEFTAEEKGDYIFSVNTTSSVDLMLLFDQAKVENAAWGFEMGSMRFSSGSLDAYILMPPKHAGEFQRQSFQLCTVKGSKVTNLTVSAGEKTLLAPVTLPATAKMKYDTFAFDRIDGKDIYRFQADDFSNVVRLVFPEYGRFMLFTEEKFARVFAGTPRQSELYFALESCKSYAPLVLQNNGSYLLNFVPADPQSKFEFPVSVGSEKITFSDRRRENVIKIPAGKDYLPVDLSPAVPGKMEFFLISAAPQPLAPAAGVIIDPAKDALLWSVCGKESRYQIDFTNLSTGAKFTASAENNRMELKKFADKFTPGVWQWQVTCSGKKGETSFFTVPEKVSSMMAYCYDFVPVMDSTLKEAPGELACRIAFLKTDEIDFEKSYMLVNGRKYPVKRVSSVRIECPEKPEYIQGRNQIKAVIVSKSGVKSAVHWGFFLGKANDRPVFTSDENGNIYCNGTPYFPVVYYGYQSSRLQVERFGFNVVLLNTLTPVGMLNKLLARNLKTIDAGSVFRGIYSKNKTIAGAEADVQAYVKTPAARHQARMGAWMDEMDVHRSAEYIRKFLTLFGSVQESNWRGVCSCNRALYQKMAAYGDYLMIDHYASGANLFSLDQAIMAGKAAAGTKPLIALLMGFARSDPAQTGFVPSNKDVEYSAFAALRKKCNGIGLYQCGQFRLECYPENWKHTTNVYRKLSALSFIAYGQDLTGGVTAPGNKNIVFRTVEFDGSVYIIAQNNSFTAQVAEMAVDRKFSGKVKVIWEERQIDADNGRFIDGFTPAGTHIYMLQ